MSRFLFYFIPFYRSGRVINGEINDRDVLDTPVRIISNRSIRFSFVSDDIFFIFFPKLRNRRDRMKRRDKGEDRERESATLKIRKGREEARSTND